MLLVYYSLTSKIKLESFDCYKIFFLGKSNSLACHTQNIKQNKNYSKFLLNKELKGNLGMSDILIQPIQRMARYNLLIALIMDHLNPNDIDNHYLKQANAKVSSINDMQYGDSSLLNLYHLIRDAPVSLCYNAIIKKCTSQQLAIGLLDSNSSITWLFRCN